MSTAVDPHEFLKALTVVLCVAAVTTVVFQRLKQPVILGYLLAGLIVGPHLPVPLVADTAVIHMLSELGVILLMFSLGLEFSLRKLLQVGPVAGITAVIQCTLMIWLGYAAGRLFGWSGAESIFAGGAIAISSTTIIAKAFSEQGIKGRLRELVVGVLVVEDLIAILLMATLTAAYSGHSLSAGQLALTAGKLLAFLVGLVGGGLYLVPRAMRAIVKLDRPETTVVASVGICFAIALLAQWFGYSVALGAFIAGSLVAESGHEKEIEHRVEPVRDIFAAVFFVSVGMMIEPKLVAEHWVAVVVLTLVVVVGKILSVTLGAFLTGNGVRTSVQAGMSLAQIGEFSFIIAALGLSLGVVRPFLYPIAVAVSAITTLVTPWLIKASGPTAHFIDRKLPHPLQTFTSLYGSWLEELRTAPRRRTPGADMRRLFFWLFVDAALLAGVIIGTALGAARVLEYISFTPALSMLVVYGGASLLALPFCVGMIRLARKLGVTLAEQALPRTAGGRVDLAAAPRRMLLVALQLACLLAVGIPLVAVTQPFLPGFQGALLLLVLTVIVGFGFWRSATNLEGHVRAGAQAIVEALARQTHQKDELAELHALLPGLGEPVPVRLAAQSSGVGKSLAELNLRGETGATVLAIRRGDTDVVVPTAKEVLREGDVLALGGTHEAIDAARALLGPSAVRPTVG
ncbi:MAG: cation:proton antiporter [Archangiaceae bacterium]|nr:cation:proton antiporter [Archangiaceae bacterium]